MSSVNWYNNYYWIAARNNTVTMKYNLGEKYELKLNQSPRTVKTWLVVLQKKKKCTL